MYGDPIMDQGCKGCASHYRRDRETYDTDNCFYSTRITPDKTCPCAVCIIKVMCNEACEDYVLFQSKFIKQ